MSYDAQTVTEDAVRVDATDPELENCIAEALTDMMSVLHPDQASVVESEPVRTFFKSVRDANYRLRKAEALKRWKESERKRMKTERTRAILNHTRSYQKKKKKKEGNERKPPFTP